MRKQLLLALGVLLLLAGWLSAFLLNSIPQNRSLYILGPTLLLGVGMGVVLKAVGGKLTAITLALSALTALMIFNQVYPNRGVSISAFQKRLGDSSPTGTFEKLIIRTSDRSGPFAESPLLETFADIDIQLFARLPGAGRMMTFDQEGHLYVSIPELGAIYQLSDADGDGFSEQPLLYHVGLDRPSGLLWDAGQLYVAEPSQLLVLKDDNRDNHVDQVLTVIVDLPDDGGHWTRTLAKGSDRFLYLSVGSRCNACEETNKLRATVLKVDPDSGTYEVFARGLRNSVGLAFSPDQQRLWGSDNGRDMLGDELPPDEINQILAGKDYGWPECYGQQKPDPELGRGKRCQQTMASQVDLPAHSAPLGIAFGSGLNAPEEYRNSLYVALHGSWNRSEPRGYKLIRIPYQNGQMATYSKDFLRGWLISGQAWGRPVAPIVGTDGNLYLSDDRAKAIYRIKWKKTGSN